MGDALMTDWIDSKGCSQIFKGYSQKSTTKCLKPGAESLINAGLVQKKVDVWLKVG